MPTPIGHLFAGAVIRQSVETDLRRNLWFTAALLFFALLPDIDFIFGFAVGDVNRYHHLFTHSFIFVLGAGLLGGRMFSLRSAKMALNVSAIFVLAGISHVLLDCLALDQRPPYGCPLLWPFSNRFFISPVVLFSDVSRSSDSKLFFSSLFNLHNLRTVAIEAAVLMPLWAVVWSVTRKKNVA